MFLAMTMIVIIPASTIKNFHVIFIKFLLFERTLKFIN